MKRLAFAYGFLAFAVLAGGSSPVAAKEKKDCMHTVAYLIKPPPFFAYRLPGRPSGMRISGGAVEIYHRTHNPKGGPPGQRLTCRVYPSCGIPSGATSVEFAVIRYTRPEAGRLPAQRWIFPGNAMKFFNGKTMLKSCSVKRITD